MSACMPLDFVQVSSGTFSLVKTPPRVLRVPIKVGVGVGVGVGVHPIKVGVGVGVGVGA